MPGESASARGNGLLWGAYTTFLIWAVVIPVYVSGLGLAVPIEPSSADALLRWSVAIAALGGLWSAVGGGPLLISRTLLTYGLSAGAARSLVRTQAERHVLVAAAVGICAGSAVTAVSAPGSDTLVRWLWASALLATAAVVYVAVALLHSRGRGLAWCATLAALSVSIGDVPRGAMALAVILVAVVLTWPPELTRERAWVRSTAAAEIESHILFLRPAEAVLALRASRDGSRQRRPWFAERIVTVRPAPWHFGRSMASLPSLTLGRILALPVLGVVILRLTTNANAALLALAVLAPLQALGVTEPMTNAVQSRIARSTPQKSLTAAEAAIVVTAALTLVIPMLILGGPLEWLTIGFLGLACGLSIALWASLGPFDLSKIPTDSGPEALAAYAAARGMGPWALYIAFIAAIGLTQ